MALESRIPARTRHYAEGIGRHLRVLTIATRIAGAVSGSFGVVSFFTGDLSEIWIGIVAIVSAGIYLAIPLLYRFGRLIAPPSSAQPQPGSAGYEPVGQRGQAPEAAARG